MYKINSVQDKKYDGNGSFDGDKTPLGHFIIEQLQERGWDMADLAEKCDRSNTFISKLIKGDTNLTRDSAIAISRALGVPYLLVCFKSAEHLLEEDEKQETIKEFNVSKSKQNMVNELQNNNGYSVSSETDRCSQSNPNKDSSLIEQEVLRLKQKMAVMEYWLDKISQKT